MHEFDWLIVGAGYAGAVMAERIARVRGEKVLLIDRRPHIAGNAYDHHDAAGILIHKYGPHIFHTNAKPIFDYLSEFTRWRPYEHRVLANVDGMLVIAFSSLWVQDPWSSAGNHWFVYNTWMVNMGSWTHDIPWWTSFGKPGASEADIRAALQPHLCRCGTHMRIVRAAVRASELARGKS